MEMSTLRLPPDPGSLSESLRGMGYTLPTAVSDIIDNSISAEAKTISISMIKADEEVEASLKILDDGIGMTRDELVHAMVLGAVSPLVKRSRNDLGRFGLGLKTASFSQCRRLTVVSKRNGEVSSFSWDLDFLAKAREWSLIENDPGELASEIKGESGTLVVWDKIDRVSAMQKNAPVGDWTAARDRLKQHLRLTFHRFLDDGDIVIKLDETVIKGWDPFFSMHPGKPVDCPEVTWPIGDPHPKARLQAFVIPPEPGRGKSASLFGHDDALNLQGFFIYRGKRLITYGGWLGLKDLRRDAAFRLARIRLDFENDGDAEWRVDIRKCTARPPSEMKSWLKQYAVNARTISERALEKSGQPTGTETVRSSLWKKQGRGLPVLPDGGNPIMQAMTDILRLGRMTPEVFTGCMEMLALAHPASLNSGQSCLPTEDSRLGVKEVWKVLEADYGHDQAVDILKSTPPFSYWSNLIDEVAGDF